MRSVISAPEERQRLGEILVEQAQLDGDKLEHALRLQGDQPIGAVLVQLGYVTGDQLARALAWQFGTEAAPANAYPEEPLLEGRVSGDFLSQAQVVALEETIDTLVLAMADPGDAFTINAIELATDKQAVVRVGSVSDIDAANKRYSRQNQVSVDHDEVTDIQQLRDSARGEPASDEFGVKTAPCGHVSPRGAGRPAPQDRGRCARPADRSEGRLRS